MSDDARRELAQRRLDYVEESDVGDSDSSDQDTTLHWGVTVGWQRQPTNPMYLGRFAEVQAPAGGYPPSAETHGHVANMMIAQTLRWQAEAELEADDARAASDAAWLEQTLIWHEDARREQEERDALSDEEWL